MEHELKKKNSIEANKKKKHRSWSFVWYTFRTGFRAALYVYSRGFLYSEEFIFVPYAENELMRMGVSSRECMLTVTYIAAYKRFQFFHNVAVLGDKTSCQ